MTHDELVTIYTVSNSGEAEIIKNALEEEGLRCFLMEENQAGLEGLAALPVKIISIQAAAASASARARRTDRRSERFGSHLGHSAVFAQSCRSKYSTAASASAVWPRSG